VREAADGEEALRQWEQCRPDLVLLDLGLPGLDGLTVVRRIRREATTPIIILSALDQERDKVAALDAGADDYLTKPANRGGQVRIGHLELDAGRRRVTIGGKELHLTPREYELLKALVANAGRVVAAGDFCAPSGASNTRTKVTTSMSTWPGSVAGSRWPIPKATLPI